MRVWMNWRPARRLATGLVFILMAAVLAVAFNHGDVQAAPPGPVDYERPALSSVPEAVAQWAAAVAKRQGLHQLEHDGKTWVLVAWGSKPTGGYVVTVEGVERIESGVILLSVKLETPEPEAVVSEAITYPADLVAIDQTDDPLAAEFGQVPTSWIIDQSEGTPLVSERVFLQTPAAGSKLGSTVRVKGAAQLFEGTFNVVLEDGHFQLVNQTETASAGGPEWGSIDLELDFPQPSSSHGHLIIMWQDAKDGSWVEELAVPVRFESFGLIGDGDTGEPLALEDISGHWAESAIEEAVARGFVNGYPDGTFQPEGRVTRAEFLKMMLAALNIEPTVVDGGTPFQDITGHWAQGYVQQAVERAFLQTDEYGSSFGPDRNISRLEMAILSVRAIGWQGSIELHAPKVAAFSDTADLDAKARGYLGASLELGIFQGYPGGTIRPEGESTRAEAVTVVLRALAADKSPTQETESVAD